MNKQHTPGKGEQTMTPNNKIIAWAKETGKKLRLSTYDMTGEEGWIPLVYADNEAGAMNKAKMRSKQQGGSMETQHSPECTRVAIRNC